jgi:zinc transport system ATP-binding protein
VSAAIELERVSIRRDGRLVVDAASLEVERAKIHVVIGPNGAGKSTLLSAILGETAFTGAIRMHFTGTGRIGYVPQAFATDKTLPITVGEFLALSRQRWPVCLGVRAKTRTRVAAILERIGLPKMEKRRLAELSGGELRRILIGNAIEPAPEILLCDEPAAGLDAKASEQLDALLCELRDKDRTTVLLISHDRAQVRRVADRVTLLHGKVKKTGSVKAVLDKGEDLLDEESPE